MQKTSVFLDFYCLANKLAPMGLRPGLKSDRPVQIRFQFTDLDGAFCTNSCLGATAKNLSEKASLYEGHGFSRAVNGLCLTASAAEVRFYKTHRFAVSLEVLTHPLRALMGPHAL
jgi:hypothetical protein